MTANAKQGPYVYPPIYHFPPFFTLQRNPSTYSSQLKLWTRFILDYCQFYRIFSLDVEGTWEKAGAGGLFRNETIKRELSLDAKREVLKALVEEGECRERGQGSWMQSGRLCSLHRKCGVGPTYEGQGKVI